MIAWLLLAVSPSAAGPSAKAAQPVESKGEEIVVTGERISRSERETASSVEVFGEKDIERAAGADRIEQILELTPNVQISSGGEAPTIRGQDATGPTRDLPAFLGGTRPRTTLVVGVLSVGFSEFIFGSAPLWDLDRIEVFRSPQTTTQGQNSIAGAIFIHTKDPSFTPEARARAIVGDFRTRQFSVVGSAPISDELAVRIAGDLRYSRPASRMADRAEGADPNHDVYGLLRFKLLAKPSALPGSRIEIAYAHSASQMPQIEGLRPPFKKRRDPVATYGTFRTNIDSLTASMAVDLATALTSSTVLSFGDSDIQRFAPEGLGETTIKGNDWSGETLLRWAPDGPLAATFGASYRRANLQQRIDLSQLSGVGRFTDVQTAFALFGEANWSLTPKLHLTAGLRYQRDSQTRSGALATDDAPIGLDYDRSFHAWLPKLSLAYDVTADVRVGALVQRAYNPGGTTLRFDTGAPDLFEAESLWDYEMFARGSFADGRVTVTANAFYYAMRNAQRGQPIIIFAPTGSAVTFADLFNVPKARSNGAELSVTWHPSANFSAGLGLGLLRTRITSAEAPYAQFEGKHFQRSPDFSASASLNWEPAPHLTLSAQARHNSGYFSDDLNQPDRKVSGWTKFDAQAAYDFARFRVHGYVRNLFDKFYPTYLFSSTFATAGDPREVGIGLEVGF